MTEHQEQIAAIRSLIELCSPEFGANAMVSAKRYAEDAAFLLAQLDAAHKAIPVAPELVAAGLCGRVYMIDASGETAACYCNAGHDGRCLGANDMPLPFPGMEQDAELRAALHPAGLSPEATEGTDHA